MPGSPVGVIFQGANSSPPICSVNKWMVSSSQRGDRAVLLQEEIDEELDPARKQELLKELNLLNQEFLLAARGTDNRMLN